MRSRLFTSILALAAVGVSLATGTEYVGGEVVVKFKPGATLGAGLANDRIGATVLEEIGQIGVTRIRLPEGMSVGQAVSYYGSLPFVEYAEPNYIAHATLTPNDPSFGSQYGPQKISCPTGWDLTTGSSAVVIAIVDTGIQTNHPDLTGKIVPGYDFVNNDNNPMDDNGHGTHCAGIAAANTNNGIGIAGVGFNCSLMGVKVLSASGSGTYTAIVNGINFAADNGAEVISMSLGGSSGSSSLQAAVDYAWGKGCVITAAAGNSNTSTQFYPAAYANCIAVGSTDQNDARSSFSNYGASWVDVAAPGSSIYSTYPTNSYATLSGTSMACPHVAGLAGLLWSYVGGATNSVVRQRIENNCDNVGSWVAKGRINVYKALTNTGGGGGGGGTTTNYVPSSYTIFSGSLFAGTLASLSASDNNRFDVRSTTSGSTRYVDWDANFSAVTKGAGVSQIVVTVENNQTYSGTLRVYLYNYATAGYTQIGAPTVGGTDVTNTYTITSGAGNYVSGSGNVIVGFYRSRGGSTTYNVRSDLVKIAVTTQ